MLVFFAKLCSHLILKVLLTTGLFKGVYGIVFVFFIFRSLK